MGIYSCEFNAYKKSMYKILESLRYLINSLPDGEGSMYKKYGSTILKNVAKEEKLYRKNRNYIYKNVINEKLNEQKSIHVMKKIRDL